MVPSLIIDLTTIDLDRVQHGVEEIERVNPHRGVMRMLDGIHYVDEGFTQAVAYKDIRSDEFWVPGHIPGRPVFPGVLMLEAAAQLASYVMLRRTHKEHGFLGFVGADEVRFRGQVVPGDRLIILGREVRFRPRLFICAAQGVVKGNIVFEAQITGMPI